MNLRRSVVSLFLLLVGELLAIQAVSASQTLTLGVFSYRPDHILQERYKPLTDYLSRETGLQINLEVK